GAEADCFQHLADRIHDCAVEANLSADAAAELLAALDNKRAQKTVADISKTVTNLSDDLKSLTSDGANPFHELIEDLEETRAELLALGEDITEIDELLDEAFTQAATHDLMSGLNVASDALRRLGSVAGGALGEVVNGLASAVDVAQQFVSGDIIGAVTNVLGEIGRAGEDVMGANAEVEENIQRMASSYDYLGEETVRSLTKTRTETVKLFGFLPVGTKQVIDQDATNAAVSAANHFAQAFASTLSSADFSVDFDTAIDDLINEAIVAEFMQSTRVQEVLAKVRELIEAGDYEAARAHWATLKDDAALLNDELVDTAEAAKRAADELQQVHLATA